MKNNNTKLSVAIATYNEEKNIEQCLASVSDFADEIVLVDGGSKDATVSIASRFTKNIVKTGNPPIFHINKQKAVEKCTGSWILQMDADETVSEELKEEIKKIIVNNNAKDGYYIPRANYFCSKRMKKGGMYPDYVVRLFRKGKGFFPCESVHEQIQILGEIGYLKNTLTHRPYKTFADYLKKADTYTSLTAKELASKQVSTNTISYMKYTFWLPAKTFLNLYIRHQGIIDGWWGFVWALYSGLHHAQAYRKYVNSKDNS